MKPAFRLSKSTQNKNQWTIVKIESLLSNKSKNPWDSNFVQFASTSFEEVLENSKTSKQLPNEDVNSSIGIVTKTVHLKTELLKSMQNDLLKRTNLAIGKSKQQELNSTQAPLQSNSNNKRQNQSLEKPISVAKSKSKNAVVELSYSLKIPQPEKWFDEAAALEISTKKFNSNIILLSRLPKMSSQSTSSFFRPLVNRPSSHSSSARIGIESNNTRFLHERYNQIVFGNNHVGEEKEKVEFQISIKPNESSFSNWKKWFNESNCDQQEINQEMIFDQNQQANEDRMMIESGGNIEGIRDEQDDVEMKEAIQEVEKRVEENVQLVAVSVQKSMISENKNNQNPKKKKSTKKAKKDEIQQSNLELVEMMIDLSPVDLPIDSKRKNFQLTRDSSKFMLETSNGYMDNMKLQFISNAPKKRILFDSTTIFNDNKPNPMESTSIENWDLKLFAKSFCGLVDDLRVLKSNAKKQEKVKPTYVVEIEIGEERQQGETQHQSQSEQKSQNVFEEEENPHGIELPNTDFEDVTTNQLESVQDNNKRHQQQQQNNSLFSFEGIIRKTQPILTPYQIARLICNELMIEMKTNKSNTIKFSKVLPSIQSKQEKQKISKAKMVVGLVNLAHHLNTRNANFKDLIELIGQEHSIELKNDFQTNDININIL